jgi:hypothetical protein
MLNSDTCDSLQRETSNHKNEVLKTNLVKIKAFAQNELTDLTVSLGKTLSDAFPDKLVSANVMNAKLDQLRGELLQGYKNKIVTYDENALPTDYSETYNGAFTAAVATTRQTISTEWGAWVVQTDNTCLGLFSSDLQELRKSSKAGDDVKWEQGANEKQSSNLLHYNDNVNIKYLWGNPEMVKNAYKEKVESAKALAWAQFQNDEAGIKKSIEKELSK